MQILNSQGVIAEGDFSGMQGAEIAPGQAVVWTFRFADNALLVNNADLTGQILTYSFATYSH